jgi:hypothetical protein
VRRRSFEGLTDCARIICFCVVISTHGVYSLGFFLQGPDFLCAQLLKRSVRSPTSARRVYCPVSSRTTRCSLSAKKGASGTAQPEAARRNRPPAEIGRPQK